MTGTYSLTKDNKKLHEAAQGRSLRVQAFGHNAPCPIFEGRRAGPAQRFEPYLAVFEDLDIPVAIHIGPCPPGAPYLGSPDYRARLHDPLALEEVLSRHPKLRLYVMHAGWPMLDNTLALLYAHSQVYVDVGIIGWAFPRGEFHHYVRRLVEAGFGTRIMFGSDQMVWPGAIERGIEAIESAEFLSAAQKRDILYNNAARFLRLEVGRTSQ